MTDTLEAPGWQRGRTGWRALGPITRDRKAYLVRADRPELAAALDDWLAEREEDGRLAALRARWMDASAAAGGARVRTAAPLPALLAAIDERLALMPLVAEAKRASGRPVEDLAREALVLDRAADAMRAAARAGGLAPIPDARVRAFFQAQIEAAKAIQRQVLAGPVTSSQPPDLASELRPCLLRLGDRIAAGLVRALRRPPGPGVYEESLAALAHHRLPARTAQELASALASVLRAGAEPARPARLPGAAPPRREPASRRPRGRDPAPVDFPMPALDDAGLEQARTQSAVGAPSAGRAPHSAKNLP